MLAIFLNKLKILLKPLGLMNKLTLVISSYQDSKIASQEWLFVL